MKTKQVISLDNSLATQTISIEHSSISINLPLLINDSVKVFDLNGSLIPFELIRDSNLFATVKFEQSLHDTVFLNKISEGQHNQLKIQINEFLELK